MSILSGNDYLPKLKEFRLDLAWEQYQILKNTAFKDEHLVDISSNEIKLNLNYIKAVFSKLNISKNSGLFDEGGNSVFPYNAKSIMFIVCSVLRMPPRYVCTHGTQIGEDGEIKPLCKATLILDDKVHKKTIILGRGSSTNEYSATERAAEDAINGEVLFSLLNKHHNISKEEYDEFKAEFYHQKELTKLRPPAPPKRQYTPEECEVFIREYLHGIGWLMNYLLGNCVNHEYVYTYPAIGVEQLCEAKYDRIPIENRKTNPLAPAEFCMLLLPKKVIVFT